MSQFLLPKHVFICLSGDHAVLLDLKKDRYLAVDLRHAAGLKRFVCGWPIDIPSENHHSSMNPTAADLMVSQLLEQGLLTSDPREGKEATPVTVAPAIGEVNGDTYDGRPQIRLRDLLNFLRATTATAFALKVLPIARVVSQIQKKYRLRHLSTYTSRNADSLQELVAVFHYLKPYAFSGREKCLFETLALINFLLRYRIATTWVFGVQTGPFAAHCWVRHGDMVLNDTVHHVRDYTPIMTV